MLAAPAQAGGGGNPKCNALVQVTNDLYLVNDSGASLARFTTDGLPKLSASLAPDGHRVAFIPAAANNTFVVADYKLRKTSYPATISDRSGPDNSTSNATLVGVTWATSDTVRLDKHIGKDTDRFEFYNVPDDLPPRLHRASPPGFGAVCVLKPRSDDVACLQGNDVVINSSIIYSDNLFADAVPMDSLTLAVGGSAPVKGFPGLRVQLKSISAGITLRVTLPNGNWIQSRVRPGDFLTVQLEDQTLALVPTAPINGTVKITVLSNNSGANAFDNALAWQFSRSDDDDRDNGKSFAVIKDTAAGLSLAFLEPTKRGHWGVLAHAPLDLATPVNTMRFVTPTSLYFETSAEFGIVPVSLSRSDAGVALQAGSITELPNSLAVNVTGSPLTTPVLAWACK
ncbi:MAG: hypothetical protein ACRECP_08420 [Methylocella sp.]